MARNLGSSAYVIESGELVVEFAAPGRDKDDVEVDTDDDERLVKVTMRERDAAPGSLLNIRVACTVKVPEKWDIDSLKAQCRNGLLKLQFRRAAPPPKPKNPLPPIGFQQHQWQ